MGNIELTEGEERYIAESTMGWKMSLRMRLGMMDEVTPELTDRIETLEQEYLKKFGAFYRQAKKNVDVADSDEVRNKFDEQFEKVHPEFYDFEKLMG